MILRYVAIAVALTGQLVPVASAAPKPPIVLTPTSQWVVDYDDESCIIARSFGSDQQRLVLRFTWFEPSDDF